MTQPDVATSEGRGHEPKLPRRDWILLPILGVFTVLFLAAATELLARRLFSESATGVARCMVLNDPATGAMGIPNSACWGKNPEGPRVEYKFNNWGFRSAMNFGPKPAGTYRIVVTGSSIVMGDYVPDEDTFAALLPAELSKLTGRRIQVYNEGMGWSFADSVVLRFSRVLQAQPDLVVWVVTPVDIARGGVLAPWVQDRDPYAGKSLPEKAWLRLKADLSKESISASASAVFGRTRTALMMRHLLYQNPSQYIRSFLMEPDNLAGFVRTTFSPEWQEALRDFDKDAADVEGRTAAAHIPFVAVYLPASAQVVMASTGHWPPGVDPYKLDDAVRAIITSHGGTFIDLLPDFGDLPDAGRYFYPVDTHPNIQGHAMIARLMARELAGGAVPALKEAAAPAEAAFNHTGVSPASVSRGAAAR